MSLITGIFSALIAGMLNGSFAAPLKKIKYWEWENTWIIYAFTGLLLLPFFATIITVPELWDVYAHVEVSVILKTLITGMLYGIGSITFGLGLHLAGLSLGYSLMIGIIAITGSLVPMLIISPESIFTVGGLIISLAMVVCLSGIIYCAKAGALREQSADKTSNEDGSRFRLALIVCIVSGLFSSMLNISLVMGQPIADLAKLHIGGSLVNFRATNAVWLITLSGAFVPYVFYCFFLFFRNKSINNYTKSSFNFYRAGFMGVLWFLGILVYGAGVSSFGKFGTTIGWLILMAFTVITGNLWGFFTGEWHNAPSEAKMKMYKGLGLLLISVVIVSIGKFYL